MAVQGGDRVPGGRGVRVSGRLTARPHQLPGRGLRRGVRPHRRPRQHPRHELEGGDNSVLSLKIEKFPSFKTIVGIFTILKFSSLLAVLSAQY